MKIDVDQQDSPLTEEEMKELDDFLLSDAVPPESLDFIGVHGFLSAVTVGPEEVGVTEWLPQICVGRPKFESEEQSARVTTLILRLANSINRELYGGESITMPCLLSALGDIETSELRGWCIGFMDGMHLREDSWFELNEELVGGLIFPIAVISGLFDEEEIRAVSSNPDRVEQLAKKIPEALTALYLFYRDPDGFSANEAKPRLH